MTIWGEGWDTICWFKALAQRRGEGRMHRFEGVRLRAWEGQAGEYGQICWFGVRKGCLGAFAGLRMSGCAGFGVNIGVGGGAFI